MATIAVASGSKSSRISLAITEKPLIRGRLFFCGEVANLRLHYRLLLVEQGFALHETECASTRAGLDTDSAA